MLLACSSKHSSKCMIISVSYSYLKLKWGTIFIKETRSHACRTMDYRPYLFAQLGCLRETPDDWDFKIRRQISHKLGEVFPPRLQHNHRHVIFHDVGAERFWNLLKWQSVKRNCFHVQWYISQRGCAVEVRVIRPVIFNWCFAGVPAFHENGNLNICKTRPALGHRK